MAMGIAIAQVSSWQALATRKGQRVENAERRTVAVGRTEQPNSPSEIRQLQDYTVLLASKPEPRS